MPPPPSPPPFPPSLPPLTPGGTYQYVLSANFIVAVALDRFQAAESEFQDGLTQFLNLNSIGVQRVFTTPSAASSFRRSLQKDDTGGEGAGGGQLAGKDEESGGKGEEIAAVSVFTRLVIPDLAQAEAATERLTSPSLGTFFFSYLDGVFPVETVQDVSAPLITPFEAPSPPPPSELDPTGENIFTGDGTLNGRILIGLIIGGVIALLACYALYLCRMTCRRHPKKSTEEEPVRLRDSKASAPNGRQTSKDSTPDERKPLSSLVLTVLSFLSCYILYFCFMIRRRTAKKAQKKDLSSETLLRRLMSNLPGSNRVHRTLQVQPPILKRKRTSIRPSLWSRHLQMQV